jgi:hypothetical protein
MPLEAARTAASPPPDQRRGLDVLAGQLQAIIAAPSTWRCRRPLRGSAPPGRREKAKKLLDASAIRAMRQWPIRPTRAAQRPRAPLRGKGTTRRERSCRPGSSRPPLDAFDFHAAGSSAPAVSHCGNHVLAGFNQLVAVMFDVFPSFIPLTGPTPDALVTVVDPATHEISEWGTRGVPLDLRVIEGKHGLAVAATHGIE